MNRLNHLFCAIALGSIDFLAVEYSDRKTLADVSPTADKIIPQPAAAPAGLAPNASAPIAVATDQRGIVADGWIAIKDDTYDQRAHFFSGLQALEKGMDRLIATMNARDGSVGDTVPDANVAEVTAARTNLQTASDELDQATADTWIGDKSLVAQAWVRMQAAFTKARSN